LSGRSTAPGSDGPIRPPAPLIALVAGIVFVALVIGCYGFLTLTLHREVIAEPDATLLAGPSMVLAAAVLVFYLVLRGSRHGGRRLPWGRSVVAALGAWFAGPAVGGVVYAAGRSEPFAAIEFFFRHAGSVFTLASVVIAFVVVLLAPFLDRPGLR
jgi:hypothetical protein